MRWRYPVMAVVVLILVWVLASMFLGSEEEASTREVESTVAPAVASPAETAVKEETTGDSDAAPASGEEPAGESDTAISTAAVVEDAGEVAVEVAAMDSVVEDVASVTSAQEPEPAAVVTAVADTTTAAPAPVEAVLDDELMFSFTGECWVEVSDAKGDVLFTDLQQPGDSLRLTGQAPFKVMLGNARVVALQLNGEPVNTQPGSNRNTLRMTVGQP